MFIVSIQYDNGHNFENQFDREEFDSYLDAVDLFNGTVDSASHASHASQDWPIVSVMLTDSAGKEYDFFADIVDSSLYEEQCVWGASDDYDNHCQ